MNPRAENAALCGVEKNLSGHFAQKRVVCGVEKADLSDVRRYVFYNPSSKRYVISIHASCFQLCTTLDAIFYKNRPIFVLHTTFGGVFVTVFFQVCRLC